MKRAWTFISMVVLLAVVLAWAGSCRKDIFVPPPPSIVGTYRGVYEYSEDDHNPQTNNLDTSQYVKVIFKADTWIMTMDQKKTDPSARMACDVSGEYTLDNGVQLDTTNSNLGQHVCTFSWLPFGSFQLIQDENDSLCSVQLTRIYDFTKPVTNQSVTITKKLCLYPSIL